MTGKKRKYHWYYERRRGRGGQTFLVKKRGVTAPLWQVAIFLLIFVVALMFLWRQAFG